MQGRRERGQVLTLFAISLTGVMLCVGLVVDGGFAEVRRRESQNAADLAALAGARIVLQSLNGLGRSTGDVGTAVADVASRNGATVAGYGTSSGPLYTNSDGVAIPGEYVGSPGDSATIPWDARGVWVPASKTWFPTVSRLAGSGTWSASASAAARIPSVPCGICVLDTSATTTVLGLAGLAAYNSRVLINSQTFNLALLAGVRSTGADAEVGYAGAYNHILFTQSTPTATQMPGPIPDPLAFLPDATTPSTSGTLNTTCLFTCTVTPGARLTSVLAAATVGTMTLNPGVYNSVIVAAASHVVLQPGTYYFTGDLACLGACVITGTNVTLVFLGNSTLLAGALGLVQVTAPSPALYPDATWPWPGVAVYVARGNSRLFALAALAGVLVQGAIYARDAHFLVIAAAGTASLDSMIVVGQLTVPVLAGLIANYSENLNVKMPGRVVTLVQ